MYAYTIVYTVVPNNMPAISHNQAISKITTGQDTLQMTITATRVNLFTLLLWMVHTFGRDVDVYGLYYPI